jgi:hypothetical protein
MRVFGWFVQFCTGLDCTYVNSHSISSILPGVLYGLYIALPACRSGRYRMRTFADKETQAKLLRDIQELYERRGKLEADIRTVDALTKLRIEKAAMRDIDAYRSLNFLRVERS